MSNSHLFLKSGFLRTPLQNGLGRYIPQLQRITLKFCKNHGASRGVRLELFFFHFNIYFRVLITLLHCTGIFWNTI
jgi:hypothetical protein